MLLLLLWCDSWHGQQRILHCSALQLPQCHCFQQFIFCLQQLAAGCDVLYCTCVDSHQLRQY
jgi:hypothetical protein